MLDDASRALNEQSPEIGITSFTDSLWLYLATGTRLSADETEPRSKLAAGFKGFRLSHRCHCRRCGKQAYAWDHRNFFGKRVVFHPLVQTALDLADLPIEVIQTSPLLA